MGLGWIQDQKVHISSAGLDVAKTVILKGLSYFS